MARLHHLTLTYDLRPATYGLDPAEVLSVVRNNQHTATFVCYSRNHLGAHWHEADGSVATHEVVRYLLPRSNQGATHG